MAAGIVLASGSQSRKALLGAAGLAFQVQPPRVDEEALRESLIADGCPPRDMADALAEAKAAKVARRYPESLVIGSDQVLDLDGEVLTKCDTVSDARNQLVALRGRSHRLWSAAVVYEQAAPVWRFTGRASLTMRTFSDAYLDAYLERNWPAIRHSVGCYHLESEGIRLFSRVEGDYFTVMGLPLIELLSWLSLRGTIPG